MTTYDEIIHGSGAGGGPVLVEVVQLPRTARRGLPRIPRGVRRLYGPLLMLALWEAGSATGLLRRDLFPSPSEVARAGAHLIADGELQSNLGVSLERVLTGLAIGTVVGVFLAVLAGLTRRGEDFVDSSMQVIKAVPNFALVPLLIMWMGIGEEPKIVLIAMGTGVAIYVNTYGAIRNVDAQLVEAATTLGAGRLALVCHVILPGSVPGFLVGLRLALTGAWLSLIFAETINAQQGIGFLMSQAQTQFRMDVVVVLLVVYAVIGLLGYSLVRFLERRLLTWRRGFEGV